MKVNILITFPSLIIQVSQIHPVWYQLLYHEPYLQWVFVLPQSFESPFQILVPTTPYPKIEWLFGDFGPTIPSNYDSYWLILEPYFFEPIPPHHLFWKNFGDWLLALFHFAQKNPASVYLPSHFLPHKIIPLHLPDFKQTEFFASLTLFHTNWLIHTGYWIPVIWGNYFEWILRGSLLHSKNPPKRCVSHRMDFSFQPNYPFVLPPKLLMMPWVSLPPIPPMKNRPSDNWTSNVFYQLYHHIECKGTWQEMWNPWDKKLISYPIIPKQIKIFETIPLQIGITAWGKRPQLLQRTIESFLSQFIDKRRFDISWIIHIDEGEQTQFQNILLKTTTFIQSKKKIGLTESFRTLTHHINHDIFLYLQDDWEFVKPFMMLDVINYLNPYFSNRAAVHFRTNLHQDDHLVQMSPSLYKTQFTKQWMKWVEPDEHPLEAIHPKTTKNFRGGKILLWESICCGGLVRDLGRAWREGVDRFGK